MLKNSLAQVTQVVPYLKSLTVWHVYTQFSMIQNVTIATYIQWAHSPIPEHGGVADLFKSELCSVNMPRVQHRSQEEVGACKEEPRRKPGGSGWLQ